jgi:hypothetical protein
MPPAQSQNSTIPLWNLKGWLELSAFPAGFGIPRPEGAKARGSHLDRRNPRVNRGSILFLVLASSVFAMLASSEIANFVMRLNNSMDVCPNTQELSRRLFIVADRNGAPELRVSSRANFRVLLPPRANGVSLAASGATRNAPQFPASKPGL